MIEFLCLFIGLLIWWFYYGLECFLNGAQSAGPWYGLTMPFTQWLHELSWNLPFVGRIFRVRYAGGYGDTANMLPGRVHFLIVCVLLPLAPWMAYRLLRAS
jgi:hypothetical protein